MRGRRRWRRCLRKNNVPIVHCLLTVVVAFLTSVSAGEVLAQDSLHLVTDSLQRYQSAFDDSVQVPGSSEALRTKYAITNDVQEHEVGILRSSSSSRFRRFCDSLSMPTVALAAVLVPGAGQLINADYWKIPLVTGSVVGFTCASVYFHRRYTNLLSQPLSFVPSEKFEQESQRIQMQTLRNGFIVASALSYSLGVADALIRHSRGFKSPFAALLSSALLPGLGQMYTQAYWKVPIIYGAAIYLTSNFMRMDQLYRRFDKALTYLLDENPATVDEFEGKRSKQDIQYFRDYYRRNRDLNLLGLSLLYVLNVIDAYVGAHLFYWNVDADLAMRVFPSVMPQVGNVSSGVLAMNLNLYF